ncbi:acyl-CoA dehydrogenase family protein [Aspergillus steynii IBT 23096]|uniref:Acyl-CoA dehydrogenase family protein n=1 Tax=Aspergillus steynii IBT 23096 TaxID=1392250 RepID=A0A2I2GF59_9EURO|nr:acyl-CoA dehydrogenase family protein [Aspergillus steynii IBT 23096]PLB51520.1 acyl-CoA dehydrogenase family protein [Aspergillus steynii IBT 23096]
MNFDLPPDVTRFLESLDSFINAEILPLQHADDNDRFFDHRREFARTDWGNGGLPKPEWEDLLTKARTLADKAGFYRFALPSIYGGQSHPQTNLCMAAIRYYLASHPTYGGGLGLANDLQNEHSVVGNFPDILMIHHFGSEEQRRLIPLRLEGKFRATFGLTEPGHGSDATFMETVARRVPGGFEISGSKKWQTGAHACTHFIIFARTSGKEGSGRGITAFLVPRETQGVRVVSYEWTMNMPTDHATVVLDGAFVAEEAVLGAVDEGLAIAQTFVHENRLRQAASSCGAARFCLDRSVERAKSRRIWGGKSLSENQAIQFPVVELATQVEMLRLLILKTGVDMDRVAGEAEREGKRPWVEIERQLSHQVAMCNFWANRLVCQAADRAIQIHGGDGYSRHYPFEHIYRHFRRYRITEGSEEIQVRKIAGFLFGFRESDRQQKL